MSSKIFTIVGGLIVTALFVAAVGLGMWGYDLNNQLVQSQADNQALQAQYDELSAEYTQAQADYKAQSEQAAADLSQTQGKLADAEAQIVKLEGELKTANSRISSLSSKLDMIKGKVGIFNTFWFKSPSAFDRAVEQSDDTILQGLLAAYKKSPTTDNLVNMMNYMIESLVVVSDAD